MKRMDIFCASQASTAICLSIDPASSCSSSNTIQLGGSRTIDRHNPIINDSRRSTSKNFTPPCSSHPPINPKAKEKNSSSSSNSSSGFNKRNATKGLDQKKKSTTAENVSELFTNSYSAKPIDSILRRSFVKAPSSDLITPPGSTRCLLSDTALLDSSEYDYKNGQVVHKDETNSVFKPSSSSSIPKSGSSDQVVVLRVSLHCKGCEGKVRKHLSRMQGVTSFNIDYAAKKVTVVGDVTPLSVLASISKVKNAQIWPASTSEVGSGTLETKKNNFI